MFGASYKIARVWGIPVKIHISLVLLLVFMGLYVGFSVSLEEGVIRGGMALVANVLMLLLVFASVALHELGHSFVAIRKGCRVRQITLMFIGGAAQMERIPTRPRDEILMAAAGPGVSLVIGFTMIPFAMWLLSIGFDTIGRMLLYLGGLNLVLAGFNLAPAFPMDGGRILRAALTGRMGRLRATYVASQIGKVLAVFMGLFGLMNGQWFLVAIAFFIYISAGAEYRMIQAQEMFRSRQSAFGMSNGRYEAGHEYPLDDDEPVDDDEVIVSPPPYREGPAERFGVHREHRGNRNRFRIL